MKMKKRDHHPRRSLLLTFLSSSMRFLLPLEASQQTKALQKKIQGQKRDEIVSDSTNLNVKKKKKKKKKKRKRKRRRDEKKCPKSLI